MKALKIAAIVAFVSATAGSAAFADVQLTLQNGRVSIVAKDATVRQILTEWARVGKTQILNVDKIPGAPLTLGCGRFSVRSNRRHGDDGRAAGAGQRIRGASAGDAAATAVSAAVPAAGGGR